MARSRNRKKNKLQKTKSYRTAVMAQAADSHFQNAKPGIFSLVGLGLALTYIAVALGWLLNAAFCNDGFLGCNHYLFIMSIPAYLITSPILGSVGAITTTILFIISSIIYTLAFYYSGAWLQQTIKPLLKYRLG